MPHRLAVRACDTTALFALSCISCLTSKLAFIQAPCLLLPARTAASSCSSLCRGVTRFRKTRGESEIKTRAAAAVEAVETVSCFCVFTKNQEAVVAASNLRHRTNSRLFLRETRATGTPSVRSQSSLAHSLCTQRIN